MTPEHATILVLVLAALSLAFAAHDARRGLREVRGALRDQGRRLASLEARLADAPPRPERRPADSGPPDADRDEQEGPDPLDRALIAVPDLARRREAAAPVVGDDAGASLDRRYGGLWELADSGASPQSIARATGMPVGRVELILGLRRHALPGEPAEGRDP